MLMCPIDRFQFCDLILIARRIPSIFTSQGEVWKLPKER